MQFISTLFQKKKYFGFISSSSFNSSMEKIYLLGFSDVPIKIRQAVTEEDWIKLNALRVRRYRSKVPTFIDHKGIAPEDLLPTARTLIAEHSVTGELLGSIRCRDTRYGREKAGFTKDRLPDDLLELGVFTYADRLVVEKHPLSRVVKLMLFKSYWLLSVGAGACCMSMLARKEMASQFLKLGFSQPDKPVVLNNIPGYENIEHRLFVMNISKAASLVFKKTFSRRFIYRQHKGINKEMLLNLADNKTVIELDSTQNLHQVSHLRPIDRVREQHLEQNQDQDFKLPKAA